MMWELIRQNRRRSVLLMLLMLLFLLIVGASLGAAVAGPEALHEGITLGLAAAAAVWLLQALVAWFSGSNILLGISGARRIEKSDHPMLYNVVEEMSIAAQLPRPPEIYVIDDPALNAFATGRSPEHSAVAVTAGLLRNLNRDQLQGVVAHEIAHIVHRDVVYMTLIGIMVGTIVLLSEVFLRSLRYGGGSRFGSSRKGGQAQLLLIVLALVLALIAPLLAQLIYLAVSRRREYLADAGAAVYTRYPEGLASALETIAGDSRELARASRATAPMYIINPLQKKERSAFSWLSTHPPVASRIAILRSLAGGVSYAAYQSAWARQTRQSRVPMPPSALKDDTFRPIRDAGAASGESARDRARDTGDLLRRLHGFRFLACTCGLRFKLPPDYRKSEIACPRCGKTVAVPAAEAASERGRDANMAPVARPRTASAEALLLRRPGKGPLTYRCVCGQQQTVPRHSDSHVCTACGQPVKVEG